jgi:phenylacetate-CoA ligase
MKKTALLKYDPAVETMEAAERNKYLEKRLKQIVRYAYDNAPATSQRFDKCKIKPEDIRHIGDLEKLPILRKDELISLHKTNPPFGGLVTVPTTELERVYISPGPIFDPHKMGRGFNPFAELFGKGDIVINTWSYHLVPAGILLDQFLREAGATVVPWGTGNTELMIEVIKDLGVTGFLGTASFLMTIIQKSEELGHDFNKFKLKKAFAGGEMGGGPLRQLFREKYGITTSDMYGTADLPPVAVECGQSAGMHLSMGLVVEIVDPETGKQLGPNEIGEVVVTVFDHIYPLIRFGTGDLSYYIDDPCKCGRTTPRLPKITGRVGEAVRTRGMFIHPRQLDPCMAKFVEVSRFQAVVTRPGHRDELTLNVELKDGSIDKEKLSIELSSAVNEAIRIKVDSIEYIVKGTLPDGCKTIVDKRVY